MGGRSGWEERGETNECAHQLSKDLENIESFLEGFEIHARCEL